MLKLMRFRGMTLVEMIITMGLLVVLMGGLLTLLTTGKQTVGGSSVHSGNVQDLQGSLWRIYSELRNTQSSLITISTSPAAFSFPSALDESTATFTVDSSTGKPKFQRTIVYYLQSPGTLSGTSKLMRREIPSKGTAVTTTVTAALSATALTAACDGSGDILASSVQTLSLAADSAHSNTYTLSLTVEAQADKTTNSTNALEQIDQQSMTISVLTLNNE